jgi:hypothetical protein
MITLSKLQYTLLGAMAFSACVSACAGRVEGKSSAASDAGIETGSSGSGKQCQLVANECVANGAESCGEWYITRTVCAGACDVVERKRKFCAVGGITQTVCSVELETGDSYLGSIGWVTDGTWRDCTEAESTAAFAALPR